MASQSMNKNMTVVDGVRSVWCGKHVRIEDSKDSMSSPNLKPYLNHAVSEITNELEGWSNDYADEMGKRIPKKYIKEQIDRIRSGIHTSESFKSLVVEQPDMDSWENDVLREYILEFSTIYEDYPIDEPENQRIGLDR
jgi:hypothetical protein